MPHYFFNLRFGDRVSQDEEGVALHDRAAAREEASSIIRELSDPAAGGNPRRWAGWFLQVADERGTFLSKPIGHPALELVTKDSPSTERQPIARRPRPLREAPVAPGERLAKIISEMARRRRETAALLAHNRQLREEILQLHEVARRLVGGGSCEKARPRIKRRYLFGTFRVKPCLL